MKHQIDDDMRLTILAALETGGITREEALQRLTPEKRTRGAPKKPKSTIKFYSVITDPKTGKAIRRKAINPEDYKTIPAQVKLIGMSYEELKPPARTEREAISIIQRETIKGRKEAYSERYIHHCHQEYLNWLHVQRYFKDFLSR